VENFEISSQDPHQLLTLYIEKAVQNSPTGKKSPIFVRYY